MDHEFEQWMDSSEVVDHFSTEPPTHKEAKTSAENSVRTKTECSSPELPDSPCICVSVPEDLSEDIWMDNVLAEATEKENRTRDNQRDEGRAAHPYATETEPSTFFPPKPSPTSPPPDIYHILFSPEPSPTFPSPAISPTSPPLEIYDILFSPEPYPTSPPPAISPPPPPPAISPTPPSPAISPPSPPPAISPPSHPPAISPPSPPPAISPTSPPPAISPTCPPPAISPTPPQPQTSSASPRVQPKRRRRKEKGRVVIFPDGSRIKIPNRFLVGF